MLKNVPFTVVDKLAQKYIFGYLPIHCELHNYEDFQILASSSALAGGVKHSYQDYCIGFFGTYNPNIPHNPFQVNWEISCLIGR